MTGKVFVCSLPICGVVSDNLPAIQVHLAEAHEGAARYLTQPVDIEGRSVRLSYSTHEWTVVRVSSYSGPESVLVARKTPGGQMRETRWVARADLEFDRPAIMGGVT